MKDLQPDIVDNLKTGMCTPQVARIAARLHEPTTTVHYNIKSLEKNGAIKAYKAVFDYKKIDLGFCCFVLLSLSPDDYGNPERIAREFSRIPQIESVDIISGDWEMILKVRAKDQEEYFSLVKNVISRRGVTKISSLVSFKQAKTEFVTLI